MSFDSWNNINEIDTILYYLFGFVSNDSRDKILEQIISKAYGDATMFKAFNMQIDKGWKDQAISVKRDAMDLIKRSLDCFEKLDILSESVFDEWHNSVCGELKEIYKNFKREGIESFSYGNAQKLVNMTMKYLYVISKVFQGKCVEIKELLVAVEKARCFLHVPIDNKIIDAIWRETNINLPIKENVHPNRRKNYIIPSEYVVGWSKWIDTQYLEIQKELRNFILESDGIPIEWEEVHWIEAAKE